MEHTPSVQNLLNKYSTLNQPRSNSPNPYNQQLTQEEKENRLNQIRNKYNLSSNSRQNTQSTPKKTIDRYQYLQPTSFNSIETHHHNFQSEQQGSYFKNQNVKNLQNIHIDSDLKQKLPYQKNNEGRGNNFQSLYGDTNQISKQYNNPQFLKKPQASKHKSPTKILDLSQQKNSTSHTSNYQSNLHSKRNVPQYQSMDLENIHKAYNIKIDKNEINSPSTGKISVQDTKLQIQQINQEYQCLKKQKQNNHNSNSPKSNKYRFHLFSEQDESNRQFSKQTFQIQNDNSDNSNLNSANLNNLKDLTNNNNNMYQNTQNTYKGSIGPESLKHIISNRNDNQNQFQKSEIDKKISTRSSYKYQPIFPKKNMVQHVKNQLSDIQSEHYEQVSSLQNETTSEFNNQQNGIQPVQSSKNVVVRQSVNNAFKQNEPSFNINKTQNLYNSMHEKKSKKDSEIVSELQVEDQIQHDHCISQQNQQILPQYQKFQPQNQIMKRSASKDSVEPKKNIDFSQHFRKQSNDFKQQPQKPPLFLNQITPQIRKNSNDQNQKIFSDQQQYSQSPINMYSQQLCDFSDDRADTYTNTNTNQQLNSDDLNDKLLSKNLDNNQIINNNNNNNNITNEQYNERQSVQLENSQSFAKYDDNLKQYSLYTTQRPNIPDQAFKNFQPQNQIQQKNISKNEEYTDQSENLKRNVRNNQNNNQQQVNQYQNVLNNHINQQNQSDQWVNGNINSEQNNNNKQNSKKSKKQIFQNTQQQNPKKNLIQHLFKYQEPSSNQNMLTPITERQNTEFITPTPQKPNTVEFQFNTTEKNQNKNFNEELEKQKEQMKQELINNSLNNSKHMSQSQQDKLLQLLEEKFAQLDNKFINEINTLKQMVTYQQSMIEQMNTNSSSKYLQQQNNINNTSYNNNNQNSHQHQISNFSYNDY